MIKRPKPTDTEDDILKMQQSFLAEQAKNANFSPAAKLVKIEAPKKLSKFAQERANKVTSLTAHPEPSASSSTTKNIIIGAIVERSESDAMIVDTDEGVLPANWEAGFPKPTRIDHNVKLEKRANTSIFAQTMLQKSRLNETAQQQQSQFVEPMESNVNLDFGQRSHIIENSEGNSIHRENTEILRNLGEQAILEERKRLLNSIDPSVLQFIKQKRQMKLEQINERAAATDVEMKDTAIKSTEGASAMELSVLNDENSKNWLNFNVIEPEKLEWMRDLPATMPKLKAGEQYEARFDWKGVLLPFSEEENSASQTGVELYLHGDSAQRPGYTLQELFRLARSTVVQQRLSALGAINGILSIYNQGYYDGIFELPISKVFFLIRYAFDDNTPTMLEVSAKALATLLYNETDEILLDATFDCSTDCVEPTLEIKESESSSDKDDKLEEKFAELSVNANVMKTDVNNDDNEYASMNDFHLAETDLIQCLLRTNILQRISYILMTLNMTNTTNLNCVKILIRIARTSEQIAAQILSRTSLIECLMRQFGFVVDSGDRIAMRSQNMTKVYILKLFRILSAYGTRWANALSNLGLDSILKSCIFVQENSITVERVKIQIEAVRCTRTINMIKPNYLIDEIAPALRYALKWIYEFVLFQDENHFLFRQCASAIIALLSVQNANHLFSDQLALCFSKWFSLAAKYGNLELSQIVLLAACLNTTNTSGAYTDFLQNHLVTFLHSSRYEGMCNTLTNTSGILTVHKMRQQDHKPLPHLHSIVFNGRNSPVFIVSERPTIYFFTSLLRLTNRLNRTDITNNWHKDGINQYIEQFACNSQHQSSLNWFLRHEILFFLEVLKSPSTLAKHNKMLQLKLAYKLALCLTDNQINEILQIFSQFIFNLSLYENTNNLTADDMSRMKSAYGKVFVEYYFNANAAHREGQKPVTENFDRVPMLATDWPGVLLLKMYKAPNAFLALNLPDKEVVLTTMPFFMLLNSNNLNVVNVSDQFLYTMITFLGKENAFLDVDVKNMLSEFVETTFTSQEPLDFESKLSGKFNFENLYIAFLDQFQGVSYGDRTFSRLMLAPLAQKHNVKWRQMVWSEHVHVLRFVTCPENELIGTMNDYLEPAETDLLLIKSYFQAINSTNVLKSTVPYKIASHHYDVYNTHKAKVIQQHRT